EGPPPVAADLRDGRARAAVLDGHAPAALPESNGRADEVSRGHLAHPGVLNGLQRDRHPGVFLVARVAAVVSRFAAQVPNAHLADAARPGVDVDAGPAQR